MIDKALEVARREWENIRGSLTMYGDIGDFNPEDFILGKPTLISDLLCFITNLIEMDKQLIRHGYSTPEALDVFTTVATKAAERLGLSEGLALAFGSGYGYVRTGWLGLQEIEQQQVIFSKIYFTVGVNFYWKFDSPLVRTKLKTVFNRFMSWQNDPQSYSREMKAYFGDFEL
jgi:hypothetical protein